MKKTNFWVQAALIGAIYAVLTIVFAPISYGQVQVRVAEALTVLPFFTSAAIPGLFVGCIIANLYGSGGIMDIVFGSLATLGAAYFSYKMPKRWLVPFPPILVNAIVVGWVLHYLFRLPLLITMGWIALGQTVACFGLGYPLMVLLEKYQGKIFKDK